MSERQLSIGIIFACVSAILGGAGLVFTRLVLPQTDAFTLSFLRWFILALILYIFYFKQIDFSNINQEDRSRISMLGLIYFAGFPILLTYGLTFTTAGRAGLLFATMPIWTLIISSIFKIEAINSIKLIAIFFAVSGIFVALGDNFDNLNFTLILGDVIVTIGVICSSVFASFSASYIKKYGNTKVLLFALITGVFAMSIFSIVFGNPLNGSLEFNRIGWTYIFILGVPCGAIMIYCWGKALQHVTPTQATLCMGLHPLTAMLLGSLMLEEQITLNLLIGFLLVFFGIIFVQIKTKIS